MRLRCLRFFGSAPSEKGPFPTVDNLWAIAVLEPPNTSCRKEDSYSRHRHQPNVGRYTSLSGRLSGEYLLQSQNSSIREHTFSRNMIPLSVKRYVKAPSSPALGSTSRQPHPVKRLKHLV